MDAEKEKRFRFRARLEAELAQASTSPKVDEASEKESQPISKPNPQSAGEVFFPRTAEAQGPLRKTIGAGLDALSLPGRVGDALITTKSSGDPYAASMGGSYGLKGQKFEQDGLGRSIAEKDGKGVGAIVRDPAFIPSMMAGGPLLGAAGKLGLTGLKAGTAAGAAAGVGSAAIHQTDNEVQGKEFDPLSAGLEVAANTVMPSVAKLPGLISKGGNKLLGRLAQEFSGVSEEALRTHGAGFGQGAKDLASAAGKQHEIGQKLVNVLDNLDDFLPEKSVVDKALQEMPPVNIGNTVSILEQAKKGGALASTRATHGKIDGLIEDLRGAADDVGNVPAHQFRQIRKEIDDLVGDAFGKESGQYVGALKQARYQMADDLIKSAEASGSPEYVEAMRSMATKLQTADKLKSFLGKSAQTRDTRAESFVSTLFGKNKTDRLQAVKAMEEIFGGDFVAEAKLANLAAELGPEGKAGLLPRQFTGRAALGPAVSALGGHFINPIAAVPSLALSSPRISGLMLSGAKRIDKGLNHSAVAPSLERISNSALKPFFRDRSQNP